MRGPIIRCLTFSSAILWFQQQLLRRAFHAQCRSNTNDTQDEPIDQQCVSETLPLNHGRNREGGEDRAEAIASRDHTDGKTPPIWEPFVHQVRHGHEDNTDPKATQDAIGQVHHERGVGEGGADPTRAEQNPAGGHEDTRL